MKHATLVLLALALLVGGVGQARAELIITFSQSGSDVTATADGTLDLSALRGAGYGAPVQNLVDASAGLIENGATGANVNYWSGITGPTAFGPGGLAHADAGKGLMVGVGNSGTWLVTDWAYTSGTLLADSSTWNNTTISGLGLTPGTYTWTWGSGATADSLEVVVPAANAVPEPSSLVLAVTAGITGAGYFVRRRRVRSW